MAVESRRTAGLVFLVAALFCLISQAEAGSYCITNSGYSTTYCASGCCGSSGSQYCCDDATTWLIVGCVLGGLFLAIVVVVCIAIKKKGKSGRVVQPATQPGNVTVVYAGGSGPYPGPPPPYGAQPMPMGAQPIPPPSYPYGTATTTSTTPAVFNYSDPAYPPPPAKAY